ncbi:MAG: hypothetical protein N2745_09745 [Syntrophorhabdaceae bacterium]|nr:hypothetical protein [Syntrophorhabdaceae bacterium]
MGSPAKIFYLWPKEDISSTKNRTEHEGEISSYTHERDVECLKNKAMITLDKIETMWEMDHNNLEVRDHFHLLRFYLKSLFF